MKRLKFIIKRLISMIVIMLAVSFLVFVLLRMSDTDPLTVVIGNNQSTPELRQALAEEYHLNEPVHIQYLRWLKGVLVGDFGKDYVDGQDIKGLIMSRLPITFGLVIMSSLIGIAVAVLLGVTAALRKGKPSDAALSGIMLVLSGAPSFLVSILVLLFMTKYVPGYSFIGTYTNFGEFLQRITIPSIIMSLLFVAMLGRITRSNMINQLQSPYITTAIAKGLKKSSVTYKHAFHNAVIPVITVAGYMIAGAIGSSVIVEQVFSLPGIGGLLITAIQQNNFPVVQILVLFMLGVYLVMSFIVDILYTVLDPRVDLK
ncbi:MAG: ABC transporter permease [Ruminococcus sp.]|nr:ABC transporter permease [Ruminococcus sp.]